MLIPHFKPDVLPWGNKCSCCLRCKSVQMRSQNRLVVSNYIQAFSFIQLANAVLLPLLRTAVRNGSKRDFQFLHAQAKKVGERDPNRKLSHRKPHTSRDKLQYCRLLLDPRECVSLLIVGRCHTS
jgi:hypothetical protein